MTKTLAMVFGVVFVLVGLLGFINNPIVGSHGFFMTDLLHNLIHVILGIALIVGSRGSSAGMTLKIVAVIYFLVAILGFVMGTDNKLLGLVTINAADNWLHLVLAIVLFAASMGSSSMGNMPMQQPPMQS